MLRSLARQLAPAAALGLTALAAPTARAQGAMLAADSALPPCLAAKPAGRWPAREIYVYAELADSTQREYLSAAGLIANVVATMALDAFGSPDSVVSAEPALTWLATQGAVQVKAYRDGRLAWSHDRAPSAALGAGPVLIAQALDALTASRAVVPWPAGVPGDSLRFRLYLGASGGGPRSADDAYRFAQSARPSFTLRMPSIEPPVDRGGPAPASRPASGPGAAERVRVEWVVDSAGRAVPSSFRAIGADAVAELPTGAGASYVASLATVRAAMTQHRYRPGRIAGCAAAMTMNDEFDFVAR